MRVCKLQVYALAPPKAQAVALETQRVWCSLAERLGMFAIKVRPRDMSVLLTAWVGDAGS